MLSMRFLQAEVKLAHSRLQTKDSELVEATRACELLEAEVRAIIEAPPSDAAAAGTHADLATATTPVVQDLERYLVGLRAERNKL
jgi:hypothetical protein